MNQEKSIRFILKGIWNNLDKVYRKKLIFLLFIILLSALAEICTLATIFPFLAFLTNPEQFWEIDLARQLFQKFGVVDSKDLILPVTIIFSLVAVLSASIRLISIRSNAFVAASIGSYLSCKIYTKSLSQSYETHIKRNTSNIITTSTSLIDTTVGVVNLILQLISSIIIIFAITILLININLFLSTISFLIFSLIYLILAKTIRRKLNSNSRFIVDSRKNQMRTLQEALSGIREVILEGLQSFYSDIYAKSDYPRRVKEAESEFLAIFPRFALEALGLVTISFFAYITTVNSEDPFKVIPLIGLFAFAAQRLLPLMQLAYASWAGIRVNSSAAISVINLLNEKSSKSLKYSLSKRNFSKIQKFDFNEIELRNISYSYSNDSNYHIKNINLKIKKGERIGIIGPTGAGKSTFIDLFMGLLIPSKGDLLIDGLNIHDEEYPQRLINWYETISHVPQNIYLTDRSILENIAFGKKFNKVDLQQVKRSGDLAEITNFVKKLRNGYNSNVGERGISLSGGQRQRIGIARAIFKKSPLLILDEATSALDSNTESKIISNIGLIDKKNTLIMIAHRISSLSNCERLIYLEDGKIIYDGLHDEVLCKLKNESKI